MNTYDNTTLNNAEFLSYRNWYYLTLHKVSLIFFSQFHIFIYDDLERGVKQLHP